MSFDPYSDEHAIQEVGFGLILDRDVALDDMECIARRQSSLRGQLPALSIDRSDEPSVTRAYLRPNGSHTWVLKVSGDVIYVECTRYTRWAKIWDQALHAFHNAFSDFRGNYGIAGVGLNVTDKFYAREEEYDIKDLFVKNDILPNQISSISPPWNYRHAWQEELVGGRKSETVEIGARKLRRFPRGANESLPFVSVGLEHMMQLDLAEVADARESLSQGGGPMLQAMTSLHASNKGLIGALLTDEMKSRIGLWPRS